MKNAATAVLSLVLGLGVGWVNSLALRKSVRRRFSAGCAGACGGAKLAGASLLRLACIAAACWPALKFAGVFAAVPLLIGIAFSTMLCSSFRPSGGNSVQGSHGRN